jgi:hypothetical protein
MAHQLAPGAEVELDEIWFWTAKESGSVEIADRLIDSITERFFAPRSNFVEVAKAIVLATAGATSDRSLQQNRHSPQPRTFATTLV